MDVDSSQRRMAAYMRDYQDKRQERRQDRLRRRRAGDRGPGPGPDRRLELGRWARARPVRRAPAGRRVRADLQAGRRHQRRGRQVVPLTRPPVTGQLQAPPPRDMRWLRVEDASAVPACRKAVQVLAERLQFPLTRVGQLAVAVRPGRAAAAEPGPDHRAGRPQAAEGAAAPAQRRTAGDQPRRHGPVRRAVGRARADQPRRSSPTRLP